MKHAAPTLALLVAATLIVHAHHGLSRLDEPMMRRAVQHRPALDTDNDLVSSRGISVVEISARTRVLELESRDDAGVKRLNGVAPIDRAQFAEQLHGLAQRLERARNKPKVVAIDVDVAPLEGDLPDTETKMQQALRALAQHADVVAIAMARTEARQVERRDKFVAAACALDHAAAAQHAPAHRVYFASPRLFLKRDEFPLDFPEHRKTWIVKQDITWPPQFPAFGTLIHLLADGHPAEPEAGEVLTALCRQAAAAPGDANQRSIENELEATDEDAAMKVDRRYHWRHYNWRLLDSAVIVTYPVETLKLESAPANDDLAGAFGREVVIVGIDGGGQSDKFTVASGDEPVSGSVLHALQAASLRSGLRADGPVSTLTGMLIDALFGLVFVGAWGVAKLPLQPLRLGLPTIGRWATAATPLLLAGALIWVALQVAARLLNCDVWINPSYVIVGLVLHSYLEGWRQPDPGAPHAHAPTHAAQPVKPFLFGADGAWRACRQLFSASRSFTGTRISAAQFADATVPALLQLGVLGAGAWSLVQLFSGH